MAVKDLTTAELEALAAVRHALCGALLPARNEDWADELDNFLIHLANSAAGWYQVKPDDAAATTVRILACPGGVLLNGVVLTYAGGTISLSAYNNDTSYVWLQDNAGSAEIAAAADGTGWPATPHIKLAEVTIASNIITAILDRRSLVLAGDGSGTIAPTFTVGRELATAKIALATNSATGNYTVALVPSNLTGNRTIKLPDASGTLVTLDDIAAAIRGLDYQNSVKDRDLTAPPGGPADGDRYIVAASPTGAWSGHAKDIAQWASGGGGAWVFTTPTEGSSLRVEDEDVQLVYGGSAWVELGTATDLDGVADGATWKRLAGVDGSNLATLASLAQEVLDGLPPVCSPSIATPGSTAAPSDIAVNLTPFEGGLPLSAALIIRVRVCDEDGYADATNATIAAGSDTELLETLSAGKDLILRSTSGGTVHVDLTDATPETVTLRFGPAPVSARAADYSATVDVTHA